MLINRLLIPQPLYHGAGEFLPSIMDHLFLLKILPDGHPLWLHHYIFFLPGFLQYLGDLADA